MSGDATTIDKKATIADAFSPVTSSVRQLPYYVCPLCRPGFMMSDLKTSMTHAYESRGATKFTWRLQHVPYTCPRGIEWHEHLRVNISRPTAFMLARERLRRKVAATPEEGKQ